MSKTPSFTISPQCLHQATAFAQRFGTAVVRQRALIGHAVTNTLRQALTQDGGLLCADGRMAQDKFIELLDVADWRCGEHRLEARVVPPNIASALYVPTMPLLAGVWADFYVAVGVTPQLDGCTVWGFADRAALAQAELSDNGLFAILSCEVLQPFDQLVVALRHTAPRWAEAEKTALAAWQLRAAQLLEQVQQILQGDDELAEAEVARMMAVFSDELWRVQGERLPTHGLEPLLERLFVHFGLDAPVPSAPDDELAYRVSEAERRRLTRPEMRARFFQDMLSPGERAALYRYLLTNPEVWREHQHVKQRLQHATGGRQQASPARRRLIAERRRQQNTAADLPVEPLTPEQWAEWMTDTKTPAPLENTTMNIFSFRNELIEDYARYVRSFLRVRDERIEAYVAERLQEGVYYPEPLVQLNPSFAGGGMVQDLVSEGLLHPECADIFRKDKQDTVTSGRALRLHRHQAEAIRVAGRGENYVLTTGTGSGKSLAYIIPIVNDVLRRKAAGNDTRKGIHAIVVYPMNALANSQALELEKYLQRGYPDGQAPVTFDKYTGQENQAERDRILKNPPDILLTNYVMLELILTRPEERGLIAAAQGLRFLVLDELHTYRGRQGADVALLVRRVRDRLQAQELQCIGTSATIAGAGDFAAQRQEVAEVASQLFGALVKADGGVIMETLERVTPERALEDPAFAEELKTRIFSQAPFAQEYAAFVSDPRASWLESTLGVTARAGRVVRQQPLNLAGNDGAAAQLATLTGLAQSDCANAIQQALLAAYECAPHPETGLAPFAFRLHQFISRGDTVYATLESEATRHLTIYGQQFKPGSREHILLPLVFCRECGQEYYCVRRVQSRHDEQPYFITRQLNDQLSDEDSQAGYLYFNSTNPFPAYPAQEAEIIQGNLLPGDWLDEQGRLRRDRREYVPRQVQLSTDGAESAEGLPFSYFAAPFRFCLQCGVSYGARQRDDFAKLASLGSEGRSTATTITSLAAVRALRRSELPEQARKLLSFTDNRQDASLQAGHFNDFIETVLLRSALYRAVSQAGAAGIGYEELTSRVFDALNLPRELYARNPDEKFQHLKDTDRALREVLGYRLYRDLERGWRITMPNLEQCGLLHIEYQSLDELCAAEEMWEACHPALAEASPAVRAEVAKVLLDFMRRELTLHVTYLDSRVQEQIKQQSSQRLIAPWALDENEKLTFAGILFARSRQPGDPAENTYLSARGGFGQYLRRPTTFLQLAHRPDTTETAQIIGELLHALGEAGLVQQVVEPEGDEVAGWQLAASALRWIGGDGAQAFHDPIRMPSAPAGGGRTNEYFVEFYRSLTNDLRGLEAREHTAQVQYEVREQREEDFRAGKLPILYCSPTMELGVDIAELNVVNMRNVPPTPANYAQRSGRAGRSGQPALVFTYCTIGSPHDQYFFKRPARMVAGQVQPPRLDLANEDLVRAHVHAVWLAETQVRLGKSLKQVLDVTGEPPSLQVLESVQRDLDSAAARQRASRLAAQMLATIQSSLQASDWYHDGWLEEVLRQAPLRFDRTCHRWRELYLAALNQAQTQHQISIGRLSTPEERRQAERLRAEAMNQLNLLTEVENVAQSDFYSYRYFASEGFLPGYSFPRLPLSAFIPARRLRGREGEYVSRPRFLAISEFGPRSIIYHEGSRYVINKVVLPVGEGELPQHRAKLCEACGYLHPITQGEGADLCERCGHTLPTPLTSLFRLQNVATKRRDKISSDEEERLRLGYELCTGVRFGERAGDIACRTAELKQGDEVLARLAYGPAATLWRINLGWTRRSNRQQLGFVLDVERGYWKNEIDAQAEDQDDPLSLRLQRVIPYVEDTRNCLVFTPAESLSDKQMASLQAALKNALQVRFQLEDNELAAEPLPSANNRRALLFYESAEGGAGVLRRLLDQRDALAEVARTALELCHFAADGTDQRRAARSQEDCEAACYDCLMSYYNQREHRLLDRQPIKDLLWQFTQAETIEAPGAASRATHFDELLRQTESELERRWLRLLNTRGHRLPSHAQLYLPAANTRPDFVYQEQQTAIYVDGPVHDYPDRAARDTAQTEQLEDAGYTVIRFAHDAEWEALFARYPNLFGTAYASATVPAEAAHPLPDWELFDERFHPLLEKLLADLPSATIEPGGDVLAEGRVIGAYLAEVQKGVVRLRLIDAAEHAAQQLREAISAAGYDVLLVTPAQTAKTVALIQTILEEKPDGNSH